MGTILDVAGLSVGHDTDETGLTGCTVVLCERGAVAGVDVRGGAPGTRETDLLRPECTVDRVHAVLLTGGSAFGLDAAGGVMCYLADREVGFQIGPVVVPIVPAAVLFDLTLGDPRAHPNLASGTRACQAARADHVEEGSVGAGTGATVGKLAGHRFATKSGIGTASLRLADGTVVGALVAVNAVGNVVDPETGRVLAGTRRPEGGFVDGPETLELLAARARQTAGPLPGANTTIGVVATDAELDKAQATRLAQIAHDGLALAIRPVHTPFDGDTLFSLATGTRGTAIDMASLGVAAVQVTAEAVVRAVRAAKSLGDTPAVADLESRR